MFGRKKKYQPRQEVIERYDSFSPEDREQIAQIISTHQYTWEQLKEQIAQGTEDGRHAYRVLENIFDGKALQGVRVMSDKEEARIKAEFERATGIKFGAPISGERAEELLRRI